MQRTRVSSSNIASIGYDASSQVLEVQFRSGSVQALMMASSHGSYLNQYVKGRFRYWQVS